MSATPSVMWARVTVQCADCGRYASWPDSAGRSVLEHDPEIEHAAPATRLVVELL